MLTKEEIKERLEKGWIKSRVNFEIMAVDKEIATKTLEEHVEKLKKVPDNSVLNEKFGEILEVKPPPREIKQAFSQIVEVEVLSKDIEALLFIVVGFAPSSIEVLEPKEMTIKFQTIQYIMNSVSEIMHRFAAEGVGGVVVSTKR